MDQEVLSLLESKSDSVRVPSDADKVFKDECIHSFTTIKNSPDGLYVCLNKFWAFSRSQMKEYHKLSGSDLFLRIKRVKSSKSETAEGGGDKEDKNDDTPPSKRSRQGSTDDNYEEQFELVVMPDFQTVVLPSSDLPQKIQDSIRGIQEKASSPVADLLLEDDPIHLELNGKQYTAEDTDYQASLQQPLIIDPIIMANWRGKSQRGGNYNSNFGGNRDRDRDRSDRDRWGRHSGNTGSSAERGSEANRSEGVRFHRPWR